MRGEWLYEPLRRKSTGMVSVNDENAESALRALLKQYMQGNQQSLEGSTFGFVPFAADSADKAKKEMIQNSAAEIKKIFQSVLP